MEDPAKIDVKLEFLMNIPENCELDAKTKLKRFCYVGSFMSVYVFKSTIDVTTIYPKIVELCKCLSAEEFIKIIKDALSRKTLVRRDEAIFALCAYLSSDVEIKFKSNVRKMVPEILETDADLFMFCKYSKDIQTELKRKSFSQTTRKAVQEWYKSQTIESLQAMWFKQRGKHGYSHGRLIQIFKISDEILGDDQIASAFFQTCTEILNPNRNKKYTKSFSKNNRFSNAVIAMSKLRSLKLNPNEAIELIKEFNFKFKEIPRYYLALPAVMRVLIQQMSYKQLIRNFNRVWRQYQYEDPKGIKIFHDILENKEMLSECNIHPLTFLIDLNELGFRWKAVYKQKPFTSTEEKRYHVGRRPYFASLYRMSFGMNEATGLRMSITMNLQENYKNKHIQNSKKLCYLEAAVALAFGYYKAEKYCNVYAFTEQRFQLNPIRWEPDMEIDDALKICIDYKKEKNISRLIEPIYTALKQKNTYDIFLVVLPSAGRSNPKKSSEFLCKFLDKYRQQRNPKAKFVIVCLRRYSPSMTYSVLRNENILEICGIDKSTTNLINNFALNHFS